MYLVSCSSLSTVCHRGICDTNLSPFVLTHGVLNKEPLNGCCCVVMWLYLVVFLSFFLLHCACHCTFCSTSCSIILLMVVSTYYWKRRATVNALVCLLLVAYWLATTVGLSVSLLVLSAGN